MNAAATDQPPNESPQPVNGRRNLRRVVGVIVFLSVAAYLTLLTVQYSRSARSSQSEIERLEDSKDKLLSLQAQLKSQRQQSENDKRVVWNLLRLCRTAEDIPDYQGDRIVASANDLDTHSMYVPSGAHALEIACSWKPSAAANPPPNAVKVRGESGENSWRVPLMPASGYRLEIDGDGKGNPIQWLLTSNHADFKPRSESVFSDGFDSAGASYMGSDVLSFPNQIDNLAGKLGKPIVTSPGVSLTDLSFHGTVSGQPYDVRFEVRLVSDRPACVTASDAQLFFILQKQQLLMPYEGGGKYDLVPSGVAEQDAN